MAQLIEECLLQAIKNDDIKAFDALMEKARCGTYRLGRFPVLSLMYLYKSRSLISEYEEKFIKIPNYEELREPVEVSRKFAEKAGKCLRLYLNEVVTPLEMLLILDNTKRLTRIFPLTKPSSAVNGRLKSIYSIRYSLDVNFEGDKIIIDRKPLSLRTKRNIAVICLCSVFAVGAAIGVPVTVNSFKIDFASQNEYTLKRDVVLTKPLKEVNCKIIGNGHKIIVKRGASLGELNGDMSDLIIESLGNAVFMSVSENAALENVTVNVNSDIVATNGTAFVALTNYGTIDGVTVNISGSIDASEPIDEDAEFVFGGIVQNNAFKSQQVYGVIKNCTVNYSRFFLSGEQTADASFGGVAGVNNGYLQDCTVTGEIVADTFDVAGVCSVNNGVLLGNVNVANLSQTSANSGWNPLASGIVLTNNSDVQNCINRGSISASLTCGLPEGDTAALSVSAAGIANTNNGAINGCKNSGAITVDADNGNGVFAAGIATTAYGYINKSVNEGAISATCSGTAYVGGIGARSFAQFLNCLSDGDVTVTAKNAFVGGIIGFSDIASDGYQIYFGMSDSCIAKCKINVTAFDSDEAYAYVGGVAGYVREARVINGDFVTYYGGCVRNCYFTGEFASVGSCFGNIVGVCGANIYERNAYTSGIFEYHNFEGNYYSANSLLGFGAGMKEDGSFVSIADKGATLANIEDINSSDGYKFILGALDEIMTKS